jgi:hypothetical protein
MDSQDEGEPVGVEDAAREAGLRECSTACADHFVRCAACAKWALTWCRVV